MSKCEIRHVLCVSGHTSPPAVSVNETMDDGSWRVEICQPCADVLGVREGDEMPDDAAKTLESSHDTESA